jgi:hypothetical protein
MFEERWQLWHTVMFCCIPHSPLSHRVDLHAAHPCISVECVARSLEHAWCGCANRCGSSQRVSFAALGEPFGKRRLLYCRGSTQCEHALLAPVKTAETYAIYICPLLFLPVQTCVAEFALLNETDDGQRPCTWLQLDVRYAHGSMSDQCRRINVGSMSDPRQTLSQTSLARLLDFLFR